MACCNTLLVVQANFSGAINVSGTKAIEPGSIEVSIFGIPHDSVLLRMSFCVVLLKGQDIICSLWQLVGRDQCLVVHDRDRLDRLRYTPDVTLELYAFGRCLI